MGRGKDTRPRKVADYGHVVCVSCSKTVVKTSWRQEFCIDCRREGHNKRAREKAVRKIRPDGRWIRREVPIKDWPIKEREEYERNRRRRWREENREKVRKQKREYEKKRRASDHSYRLSQRIASQMWCCLNEKTHRKAGKKWQDLVGYNLQDLKLHLQSKFREGMTWENLGKWHIDHIRPQSSFRFDGPDDDGFKECWSLNNLQPLWARENAAKRDKIDWSLEEWLAG